jgi:polysaccharide biosynthesis transport protein
MADDDKVEIGEYLRIIWRRKWIIVIPTLLVGLTAWVGLHFITPIYESNALIQIHDQDEVDALAAEFADERGRGGNRSQPRSYEREKVSQLNQELGSQRFLAPVGERLGLDRDPRILAAAQAMQDRLPDHDIKELTVFAYTARLKRKIRVEPAGIALYSFICQDEDPHFAYALAKAISDEYLKYNLGEGIHVVDRAQEFSAEQLERYQKLLTQAEDALESHQRQIQNQVLYTTNPITADNVAATRAMVDEADLELATLERRIHRGLDRMPPSLGGVSKLQSKISSPRLSALGQGLTQVERNQVPVTIQGFAAGTTTGVVGSEVANTRKDLFNEIEARVLSTYPNETLDVQQQARDVVFDQITLNSVRARKERILELLNGYSAGMAAGPEQQLELRRLQDEVDRYRSLVANIQERRITDDLRRNAQEASVSSRVKIIEPPAVPLKPAAPDRMRILLFAFLAGPLLGLGAVVIAEYMDSSLRTVEDIEAELGLPVLGTIPRLEGANLTSGRKPTRTRAKRVEVAG